MSGMISPTTLWTMKRSVKLADPPPRLSARLVRRETYAGGLFRIGLLPEAPFSFRPGDCVGVYGAEGNLSRPYSLAGGTEDAELELLIRRIPGGLISDWLFSLPLDSRVEISPPFGWFHPGEAAFPEQVWLATGSGVAPFLSALRSGGIRPIDARWGVRSALDLQGIDWPYTRYVSRGEPGGAAEGRVTYDVGSLPTGPEVHYYLCGLDAMIEEMSEALEARGVDPGRIHRECFFQSQAR
jgi:ferredoxin-NAD(P)+ reductase (naphthalene dioxygenase ferredoxin-specific)